MSITTDTLQGLPVGTWALDPVHSTIGFEADYLAGAAKVASVDVKDENLAAHLQSPDFFDAERYPELSFESSEIERAGDQITVRGGITIKGVEKPVELTGTVTEPITDPYGRERISLKLDTTVDRSE